MQNVVEQVIHNVPRETAPDISVDVSAHDNSDYNIQAPDTPPIRAAHFKSAPTTPSMRTGPPRTLSYVYSLPNSPAGSRSNSKQEPAELADNPPEGEEFPFSATHSEFRSALEVGSGSPDRGKGKKRESWFGREDNWNPIKWFQESPSEEKPGFDFGENLKNGNPIKENVEQEHEEQQGPYSAAPGGEERSKLPEGGLRRSYSVPHSGEKSKQSRAKWSRLRSLIPNAVQSHPHAVPEPSAVAPQDINITDELITSGLSALLLRLWFERNEYDQRRIPVLLQHLRIRISDSLHPLHGHKSVFRIECEYANGAARWVVYRQLRDFISLHTHYSLSNAYNRNVDNLPDFPRTSLPYFKFLKKEGKEKGSKVGQADFALLQRQALENYLLDLIRAVMFHPASNRLAGFLEISALFVALAGSGGVQYKGGMLKIEVDDTRGFGRKGISGKAKREARWCAVRESYIVVLDEPGELSVWDVFLLDSDFTIERPRRYYRQGLNLLHPDHSSEKDVEKEESHHLQVESRDSDRYSRLGSIRHSVSRMLPWRRHNTDNDHDDNTSVSSNSSSNSSDSSRPPTPMLDPSTNVNPLSANTHDDNETEWQGNGKKKLKNEGDVSKHTFYIQNSQMRLKLYAKSQRQMLQWITALERSAATTHYTGTNRFDSFAPIRLNVAAQWLVDGRDYFWNLSRAMLLAKETIYIHDWWLSPELEMRRPGKPKYRLDRLLERKAKEGVKIYVIVYQEVTNRTTPTDSNYTKQRLTALHPNIMVQRSPSHFQTGTFYWAHHEKLCVIDQTIMFMGGLDLCFGRWDTPQHVLSDNVADRDEEIWPGKDYSNPRVADFHTLNKPEEDMYDRSKVPRMPWHDVGMQVVGQPARDIARHFVQRWNYLLRIKNHKRVMPFLLPPAEFRPGELTRMGLTGTCEMQICRSAGPWSLGTPTRIEHSIQNAYLKAIQMSEHFVYIENQFFITSTVVNDVKIENKIGDAIVHRIIRAHHDGTPWKCCIVIPLLPGFTFPVDHPDASALRIILECQNRTIARGPNSIYARLKKEGINPEDYLCVFSLRNWAKLRGDVLTTEQVYIHGKVCIVDDRLAIIGSANINERSQRGDRDSEIAAVIRDTDMMDGTMAGKPFKVGRFAHTLRVRLMREHLGVDVDSLYEEDLTNNEPVSPAYQHETWDPDGEQEYGQEDGVTHTKKPRTATVNLMKTAKDGIQNVFNGTEEETSIAAINLLRKSELASETATTKEATVEGLVTDRVYGTEVPGVSSTIVPTLEEKVVAEQHPELQINGVGHREQNQDDSVKFTQAIGEKLRASNGESNGAPADVSRLPYTYDQPVHARNTVDDATEEERAALAARTTIRRQLGSKLGTKTWKLLTPKPIIDPHGFGDPVSDKFWTDVWMASAVHNTEIFRKVFHAVPDDLVTTWKQYKEFVAHHERLNKPVKESTTGEAVARVPSETGDEGALAADAPVADPVTHADEGGRPPTDEPSESGINGGADKETRSRRPARGTEPFDKWERDEMEKLLGEVCGHLVLYPIRFLEGEDVANNFLFNADRLLPLPIYD